MYERIEKSGGFHKLKPQPFQNMIMRRYPMTATHIGTHIGIPVSAHSFTW